MEAPGPPRLPGAVTCGVGVDVVWVASGRRRRGIAALLVDAAKYVAPTKHQNQHMR